MAQWLLDTNLLVRLSDPSDVNYSVALHASTTLLANGDDLHVTAQNLVEFWAVATRPNGPPANGLGLSISETQQQVNAVRNLYRFVPDSAPVFPEWERLVAIYGCSGKQAHDARLVAVMLVNGLDHLLSFNDKHFTRFTEITVVNPHDV